MFIALVAFADDALTAGALFVAAGAAGASVQSASGRAVMQWFPRQERGLAFGIRQTAIPVGGLLGALALPALVDAGGLAPAFVFLGALCLTTAAIGSAVVRELPSEGVDPHDVPWTLRDSRLWMLSGGSSLYVTAQAALFVFLVLFLHDELGLSTAEAAAVFGVAHAFAMVARIAAGRWSDVVRSRIVPLRQIGLATFAALARPRCCSERARRSSSRSSSSRPCSRPRGTASRSSPRPSSRGSGEAVRRSASSRPRWE